MFSFEIFMRYVPVFRILLCVLNLVCRILLCVLNLVCLKNLTTEERPLPTAALAALLRLLIAEMLPRWARLRLPAIANTGIRYQVVIYNTPMRWTVCTSLSLLLHPAFLLILIRVLQLTSVRKSKTGLRWQKTRSTMQVRLSANKRKCKHGWEHRRQRSQCLQHRAAIRRGFQCLCFASLFVRR